MMEWEDRVEMVKLGNAMNNRGGSRKDFHDFVLKHIESFVGQDWGMFCTIVDIVPEEMKKDIEFWKKVYPYLKKVISGSDIFSFREGMRLAMLQIVCEKNLDLK